MHSSGPGKDPSLAYTPSTSKGHSGVISPPSSSTCHSIDSKSSSNKVPKYSDTSNAKSKFEDDPDVIELSNQESLMYNNCAKNNQSENQFSILASSSALNNNQVSNDSSETKVPNTLNTTNDTSTTKVPIAAFAASSTSSILSTTLLSASIKASSSSLDNSINSSPSNSYNTQRLQNNNNSMLNHFSCSNNSFNVKEGNETPMKLQNTSSRKMMNSSFENSLIPKSSSDR